MTPRKIDDETHFRESITLDYNNNRVDRVRYYTDDFISRFIFGYVPKRNFTSCLFV